MHWPSPLWRSVLQIYSIVQLFLAFTLGGTTAGLAGSQGRSAKCKLPRGYREIHPQNASSNYTNGPIMGSSAVPSPIRRPTFEREDCSSHIQEYKDAGIRDVNHQSQRTLKHERFNKERNRGLNRTEACVKACQLSIQ